jgi:hypothetical protein
MNAAEIRAEAIERIAKSRYESHNVYRDPPRAWASVSEHMRQSWRRAAEPYVDDLGDMLPDGEQWGLEADEFVVRMDDEAEARYLRRRGGLLMRRWTHSWTEVTK